MILRPSRQCRGEDPHLQTRMLIFVAGAVLALTGIRTERSWLVWIAVAVLATGVLLGWVGRRGDRVDGGADAGAGAGAEDDAGAAAGAGDGSDDDRDG